MSLLQHLMKNFKNVTKKSFIYLVQLHYAKNLHDNALQKDSNKNITADSDKSKSLDNLASGVQFDKKAGSSSKTNTRPMVSYFIVLYYISNRVFYPKTHYLFLVVINCIIK